MHYLLVLTLFLSLLSSSEINQKLIINGDINTYKAEKNLLKTKAYFIENFTMRKLSTQYNLKLTLETLGQYSVVVLQPINSLKLKIKLLSILSVDFPNMIVVDSTKRESKKVKSVVSVPKDAKNKNLDKKDVKAEAPAESKSKINMISEIGLQWIALLLLSVIGLLMSISNRRKVASLAESHRDLSDYQERVEKEIKNLGVKRD